MILQDIGRGEVGWEKFIQGAVAWEILYNWVTVPPTVPLSLISDDARTIPVITGYDGR